MRIRGPSAVVMTWVLAACTTFGSADATPQPGGDGGPDGQAAEGGSGIDASGPPPPGTDAAPDAPRGPTCTAFDGTTARDGWQPFLQGGGTLAATTFMGLPADEAKVAGGGRAAFTRNLTMKTPGRFSITADLHIAAETTANAGWTVDLLTIVCAAPVASKLTFELVPGGTLEAEVSPRGAATAHVTYAAPPQGWQTLDVSVDGQDATIGFNGTKQLFPLDATASYKIAVGCVLTVGAVTNGIAPSTTVHLSKVCLD